MNEQYLDTTIRPVGVVAALLMVAVAAGGCPSCQETFDNPEDGFVVLLNSSPDTLDPRFANDHVTSQLTGLVFEGLISLDTEDGTLEYRLAEQIEQTEPTRYEVRLRDDAVFHDGTAVTAGDVEYTYTTLRDVGSPQAGISDRIEQFEVIDEHEFAITLDEPHAPFEQDLGLPVVPRHLCEGHEGACPGDPVGSGPFQFEDRDGALEVTLAAFDDYYDGSPAVERLIFRVIQDDNARLLALLGDTADMVQNAVSPMMMPVVEDEDDFQIQTDPSVKYTYLGLNLEHEPLDELKVRQAIAHAIDREEIIEYKFRGKARLSTGLLVPEHWAYEGDVTTYDYSPSRARQLLDEAGHEPDEDGVRFELEFKISADDFRRSVAQLIAQQLGEVGIDVRVRSFEWGTFFDDIQRRNFQMTTMQWPSVQDPNLFRWIFHSDRIPSPDAQAFGANRGGYVNERVDDLLDDAKRETDRQRRNQLYSEVQQILADELPYISLWHEHNTVVLREGTEGYYTTPGAYFDALRHVQPPPDDS